MSVKRDAEPRTWRKSSSQFDGRSPTELCTKAPSFSDTCGDKCRRVGKPGVAMERQDRERGRDSICFETSDAGTRGN
jgi:hypothetical protein